MDHDNHIESRRKRQRAKNYQNSKHRQRCKQNGGNNRKSTYNSMSNIQTLIEEGLRMQREKECNLPIVVEEDNISTPACKNVPVQKNLLSRSIISQWYNHSTFQSSWYASKFVNDSFSKWQSYLKLVLPFNRDKTMRSVFDSTFTNQFAEMFDRPDDIVVAESGEVLMMSKFGQLFVKKHYHEPIWDSMFSERRFVDTCFVPDIYNTRNPQKIFFAVLATNTNNLIVSQYVSLVKLHLDNSEEPTESVLFTAEGNSYTSMVPNQPHIVLYNENRVSIIHSSENLMRETPLLSFPANSEISVRTVAQLPVDDSLSFSPQVQYVALRNGKILRLDMRMPAIRAGRYSSSIDRFVVGRKDITGEVSLWDLRYSPSSAMSCIVQGKSTIVRRSRCFVSPDDDVLISPYAGSPVDNLTMGIFNLREAIASGKNYNNYNINDNNNNCIEDNCLKGIRINKYLQKRRATEETSANNPGDISSISLLSSIPLPAYCQSIESDVLFARHQFSSRKQSEDGVNYHRNCHLRLRDLTKPTCSNDVIIFRGLDNM